MFRTKKYLQKNCYFFFSSIKFYKKVKVKQEKAEQKQSLPKPQPLHSNTFALTCRLLYWRLERIFKTL